MNHQNILLEIYNSVLAVGSKIIGFGAFGEVFKGTYLYTNKFELNE